MALRNQVAESSATWDDPELGINLRSSDENLKPGESRLMQNCEFFGSVRLRRSNQRVNSTSLGPYAIKGGHMFYYGGAAAPQKKNLIAYNNRLSVLSGAGVETVLTSSLSANKNVFMSTWSIKERAYIANAVNALSYYDGTTYATLSGTNIPILRTAAVPVRDRLLGITNDGIERTDPRSDTVWSRNSSWATLRPSQQGPFTALHPTTLKTADTILDGAIALQGRAYYLINGTNYGDDVTELAEPVDNDASIKLIDGTVGTSSPYSLCTVPGVGTFWFTSDANIFWIPDGGVVGRYVGDKLQSTVATLGLNNVNFAALDQVWISYHERILMIGIPVYSNQYATVQFWMDMRSLMEHPDRGPVWYGPMLGQSIGRVWNANQQGESTLYGGEGNPGAEAFVYTMRVNGRYIDAIGASDIPVSMEYIPPFLGLGSPSKEKYLQAIHVDANSYTGRATVDIIDTDGALAENIPLQAVTN